MSWLNQGWASNRSKVRVKIKSSRTNELMIFWTSNFSEKVNSRTNELLQFFQGRTFELMIFDFSKWTRTRELTNFDFFSEHELSNFWSLTFFCELELTNSWSYITEFVELFLFNTAIFLSFLLFYLMFDLNQTSLKWNKLNFTKSYETIKYRIFIFFYYFKTDLISAPNKPKAKVVAFH